MFSIDSHFVKGSTHRICEDYANHNSEKACLSDGCSSAKNSQVGAMLLVESALNSEFNSLGSAVTAARVMGVDTNCLHATLGTVAVSGESIYGYIVGDGVLWSDDKTEEIEYSVQLNGKTLSAPYYPIYRIKEHYRSFEDLEHTKKGKSYIVSKKIVIVFSDGVSSFVDSGGKAVPTKDVIDVLTDFKNLNGEFIYRRMNKCFKKIFPKLGWVNTDDLSMAGIAKCD